MEISKNTVIGASLGTLLTIAGTIWSTAIFVNGKVELIDQAIAAGATSQVARAEHDLKHEREKRLELRSYTRKNPTDHGAQEDLDEVNDKISDLQVKVKCLRDQKKDC